MEAISWALNLASAPAGCGGLPSSACKFCARRLGEPRLAGRGPRSRRWPRWPATPACRARRAYLPGSAGSRGHHRAMRPGPGPTAGQDQSGQPGGGDHGRRANCLAACCLGCPAALDWYGGRFAGRGLASRTVLVGFRQLCEEEMAVALLGAVTRTVVAFFAQWCSARCRGTLPALPGCGPGAGWRGERAGAPEGCAGLLPSV